MNTTHKGNKLENQIYDLLCAQINNNQFIAKKEQCKIYRQKGYYSKDRCKDIIFDIVVEIYFPGHQDFSILFIVECKNYKHAVSVDDIEEFFAKTQQISGCNTKGIVVTTSAFQKSALNFSKSKGIGLVRYFSHDELDWVLMRSPSSTLGVRRNSWFTTDLYEGLQNSHYRSKLFDCYCYSNEISTNSLHDFFINLVYSNLDSELVKHFNVIRNINIKQATSVTFLTEEIIEKNAYNVLASINYIDGLVPLDIICTMLKKDNGLEFDLNCCLEENTLGTINFSPLRICIDPQKAKTNSRARFTLAHELGHYFLGHHKYMGAEKCSPADIDIEQPRNICINDIRRMEWQANHFASCLLLPRQEIEKLFVAAATKENMLCKWQGTIYLDSQDCNITEFYKIIQPILNTFQVSKTVIKIRLKKIGYINEKEEAGNIRSPVKNIFEILLKR